MIIFFIEELVPLFSKLSFFGKGQTFLHACTPTDLQTYRPTDLLVPLFFIIFIMLYCSETEYYKTFLERSFKKEYEEMMRGIVLSNTVNIRSRRKSQMVEGWATLKGIRLTATDRSGRPDRAVHIDLAPRFGKDRGRDYMYEPKPVLE